ncbi:MAG: hypothetical protein JNL58_30375 [Planctomyces sp.]|nr:hypothetical protein [Planctomyces sp.]
MNETPNSDSSTSPAAEVSVPGRFHQRVASWISIRRKRIAAVVVLGMMAAIANETDNGGAGVLNFADSFKTASDTEAESADDFFAAGDLEEAPEFSGSSTGSEVDTAKYPGNDQQLPGNKDVVPSNLNVPQVPQESTLNVPPLMVRQGAGEDGLQGQVTGENSQSLGFQVPAAPASWEGSGNQQSGAAKPVRFRGTIVPVK